MKRHDPIECQTCQICNKNVYGNIDRHMRTHEQEDHKCNVCDAIFPTRKQLQTHRYGKHSKGEFYCDICDKGINFKTKFRIRQHMSRHINEALLCKPPADIENHQLEWLKAQQNEIEKRVSVDEYSKLEKDSPNNRSVHICSKCGKVFSSGSLLEDHVKRRHDESRWKVCPICNKSFPDGLSRHMNSHYKVRNHVCDACGRAYTQVCYVYSTFSFIKKYFTCIQLLPIQYSYSYTRFDCDYRYITLFLITHYW